MCPAANIESGEMIHPQAGVLARVDAARAAASIVDGGKSSSQAISAVLYGQGLSVRDQGMVKEMALGVVRWYWTLEDIANRMLKASMRKKDRIIFFLILVGLYQLKFMRIPPHAVVNATVSGCEVIGKPWTKALVNGMLRNYQRRSAEIDGQAATVEARTAHPRWIHDKIRAAWPEQSETILDTNNRRPPMSLRVNLHRIARDQYLECLWAANLKAAVDVCTESGIVLEKPTAVESLPGFVDGLVSVQDIAAQLIAPRLDIHPGHRVLDACAAPGGKTAHMLEIAPGVSELVALEADPGRLEQLRSNLERLGLAATCVVADGTCTDQWWDGRLFDRILIDAPCTGSGVIRRHPDIKHHRRATDLIQLCRIQSKLLDALWPLLVSGGKLMYVTCSVFPEENESQIGDFLARHSQVEVLPVSAPVGLDRTIGRQTLNGVDGLDGFFFTLLRKRESGQ